MEWKYLVIGLIAGAVVGYFRVGSKKTAMTPKVFG